MNSASSLLRAYVFLDIDGVLNRFDSSIASDCVDDEKDDEAALIPFDDDLLRVFATFLEQAHACCSPRVVLTSSHRVNPEAVAQLEAAFARVGCQLKVAGCTPDLHGKASRGEEIFEFLCAQECVDEEKGDNKTSSSSSFAFVIIDDMELTESFTQNTGAIAANRLVQTNETLGFTVNDANKALAMLQNDALVIDNGNDWMMERKATMTRASNNNNNTQFSRSDFLAQ